eukprot:2920788-Amphidinium_carterae.1
MYFATRLRFCFAFFDWCAKERSRRVALRSVLAAAAVICMAATTTDSGSFLVLGSAPRFQNIGSQHNR